MEIPRHWRRIDERNGFRTKVVLHAPDYDVVETFGNNLLIVSKNGYKNVQLSNLLESEPIYPELKNANERHAPKKSKIIYSAPK